MSTATITLLNQDSVQGVNPKKRMMKARTHRFQSGTLYNVLPSNITSDTSICERCQLFSGDVYVEEFLHIHENGSVDQVPSYKLRFGWEHIADKFFVRRNRSIISIN